MSKNLCNMNVSFHSYPHSKFLRKLKNITFPLPFYLLNVNIRLFHLLMQVSFFMSIVLNLPILKFREFQAFVIFHADKTSTSLITFRQLISKLALPSVFKNCHIQVTTFTSLLFIWFFCLFVS